MTATGNITIEGSIINLPTGVMSFGPSTISSSQAAGELLSMPLNVGNNVIALPSGVTSVIIQGPQAVTPPPNPPYQGVVTVKGALTDTGLVLHNQFPTVLSFSNSPAALILSATVATTVSIWVL